MMKQKLNTLQISVFGKWLYFIHFNPYGFAYVTVRWCYLLFEETEYIY